MKKSWAGILFTLILLVCGFAMADTAEDITDQCTFKAYKSGTNTSVTSMFDGNYKTYWQSGQRGYLDIKAPKGKKIHALYINWYHYITDWVIQIPDGNGGYKDLMRPNDNTHGHYADFETHKIMNQYLELGSGYTSLRLLCQSPDSGHALHFAELHVLGDGDAPEWCQQWKEFTGKADLLLLVTDPGDEYLYFDGLIPYYIAQGKEVMVCVIVNTNSVYKNQMLDGLWHCGLRNYPYFAYFRPKKSTTLQGQYSLWGELQFTRHVTRIFRIYKPDVFVTHSRGGEGNDGGRKACADAAIRAVRNAVDKTYDANYSLKYWGEWKLPKLYLHDPNSGELTMNFDKPLDYFDGKTAFEVASEAYLLQSYQKSKARTLLQTGLFNGTRYHLQYSSVGDDSGQNDMFEHITSD